MKDIGYHKIWLVWFCAGSLFVPGCATDSGVFKATELTSQQQAQLAALAPKIQEGDSAACDSAGEIYSDAHQYSDAIQVLRTGAHFNTPRADDNASLACVESLYHLYAVQGIWTWDSDYATIMTNLNLAYTYVNYLAKHGYTGIDVAGELSNIDNSANLAAQIHQTRAEGLSEISDAFNQAANNVAGAIH
jgi:hypothetical protein